LSLPDETASDATVATFYAQHRTVIVVLQLMGLAAAVLLAAYSARLRHFDRAMGNAGLVTAVLACAPGLVTLVLALIADAANPSAAGTWNAWNHARTICSSASRSSARPSHCSRGSRSWRGHSARSWPCCA
jgi:hypothetical protein